MCCVVRTREREREKEREREGKGSERLLLQQVGEETDETTEEKLSRSRTLALARGRWKDGWKTF